MTSSAPFSTVYAPRAMVSTVDSLATQAGLAVLRSGGNAIDAAIAANAVLTVTLPNQCGLGGDLFAVVKRAGEAPQVLLSAGRAGAGADADALRAAGHRTLPTDEDMRSVTLPGCVDGWAALSSRHGSRPLAELLAEAVWYAETGFPASAFLADVITRRAARSPEVYALSDSGRQRPGGVVRRPDAARMLRAVADGGRDGFFLGEFGARLLEQEGSDFRAGDLVVDQAEWLDPVRLDAWGGTLWSAPPPSQGYLLLSAAWLAARVGLPDDPADPAWAHLLIEATRFAAYDRPEVLFDGASGAELLAESRLAPRAAAISPERAAVLGDRYRAAGTTYLSVVDDEGTAVSLIQSNCMSFGSGIVPRGTGVWLHNRGIGFSLDPGHPAELRPGARPPHTLAPAMITDGSGTRLRAVLGTRGGDSQPQIVLQLAARLLAHGQEPAEVLSAGRWILRGESDSTSFRTWESRGSVRVGLEGNAAPAWGAGLERLGHVVEQEPAFAHQFGHAQLIVAGEDGVLSAAADPRSDSGAAAGY